MYSGPVRRLTVHNPANRFEETELVYLEGEDAPAAGLEVYFDRTEIGRAHV